jgi:glycerophosphoryl diester phosphodiesterase
MYGRRVESQKKGPFLIATTDRRGRSKEAAINSILRIGHRGAAGYAPENTLAAIWKARSLCIDMVEVDVRRTSDGRLVLLHDETIDRTTNEAGWLGQLSLEQVRQLNAGNRERIPTLEEALEAAGNTLGMVLELKEEGIGMEAVSVVRRSRFEGTVIYASFLYDELMRLRSADRMAAVMLLLGETLHNKFLDEAVTLKASHIGFSYPTLTPELVKTCHEAGFAVCAYTVNDALAIRRVRDLRVDGIISDFPDRI